MNWIKLTDGHKWLLHQEIGAIASIEDNGHTQWQSPDGDVWQGGNSTVEEWLEFGYEKCTQEQAKMFIEDLKKITN